MNVDPHFGHGRARRARPGACCAVVWHDGEQYFLSDE